MITNKALLYAVLFKKKYVSQTGSPHLRLADVKDVAATAGAAHAGTDAAHGVAAGPDERADNQQRGQELEDLVYQVHIRVPETSTACVLSRLKYFEIVCTVESLSIGPL